MRLFKSYIILLTIITNFYSCIDEPQTPNEKIIKCYKHELEPNFSFYLASINDYPILGIDNFNTFNLSTYSLPYNLVLYQKRFWNESSTFKFINISNEKNHVYMDDLVYTRAQFHKYCTVEVEFPYPESFSYIKFISSEPFNETQSEIYPTINGHGVLMKILIPSDKNHINGKICYIEETTDGNDNVVSYDKFGIKSVTLNSENNSSIIFTKEDIILNPPEIQVPIKVDFLNGFNLIYVKAALSSPELSAASDIEISDIRSSIQNLIVPDLFELGFQIKLTASYVCPSYGFLYGLKWVYSSNNSPINLQHIETVQIITPRDGSDNISDSTVFELSDTSPGNCIYEFNLYSNGKRSSVYSTNCSIKLFDFKSWGYEIKPNTSYLWGVRKFKGFHNLNDFLESPYPLSSKLEDVNASRDALIRTADVLQSVKK